jgi:hypothetical protein
MSNGTALSTTQSSNLASKLGMDNAQLEFISKKYCNGAPPIEVEHFIRFAQAQGLDISAKQAYLIGRNDKNSDYPNGKSYTIQIAIDGYRAIAEATDLYDGQDAPVFETGANGSLISATVTVYRKGMGRGVSATAFFSEYNAGNSMWTKMPRSQLAKCFSEDTEVLTDQGFQRFSEVSGRILQVTDQGVEPCDARPFVQEYSGPMVTLDSDDLNFCVTPNHDMVTTNGKIEAGTIFEKAMASQRTFMIPRHVGGSKPLNGISDADVALAAAVIADGSLQYNQAIISVSRERKIEALRVLSPLLERAKHDAGRSVKSPTRTITTLKDKITFCFSRSRISWLIDGNKNIDLQEILKLSKEQARVFVDSWIHFDGHHEAKSNVRRVYINRIDHVKAFELAAVIAGYAVSPIRKRTSDLSKNVNHCLTISDRNEIPVFRWGRSNRVRGSRKHTGLELQENATGKVWCVTVPSGIIVVRRSGFSMLCGNCAEALALRKAFPKRLGGTYVSDEMHQAGNDTEMRVISREPEPKAHQTPDDAERATLVKQIYSMIFVDPAIKGPEVHQFRLKAVADRVGVSPVPQKWGDFTLDALRSFVTPPEETINEYCDICSSVDGTHRDGCPEDPESADDLIDQYQEAQA